MATDEKALAIFREFQLPEPLQARVLDMAPDFHDMPEDDQRALVEYWMEQAKATTEGVKARFPRAKMLHAGTVAFELPPEPGSEKGKIVREFDAIILDQHVTKAWWKDPYGDGGGGYPDCASLDGLKPYTPEPVASSCIKCALNRFGSGKDRDGNATRGKACRDTKRVIFYLDGHDLPLTLQISAANIKRFDSYMNALRDQGQPIGTVRTRFKAVEVTNKANVSYTGIELSTVDVLSIPEQLGLKRNVLDLFKSDFRIGAIEFDGEGSSERTAPSDTEQESTAKKAADIM
jgi:hypothetical protein